jgi:hypothetical protein
MFAAMQIPQNPFLNGPGILRQPQPGSGQQVNSELQIKAQAQSGSEAARPVARGARSTPGGASGGPGATGLATAGTLDEAVRSLAADGRLPRRGSLIDLKA